MLAEAADAGAADRVVCLEVLFAAVTMRYLKVLAHSQVIPAGCEPSGQAARLSVDEMAVD